MSSPPVIGLAGGIGSGKSTVAKTLADLGCIVSDSDAAARAALDDLDVRARIVEHFGERVLDAQGRIDRSALASIVFRDAAERSVLESITHPWIEQRRLDIFRTAPPGTPALVIDAPLLFEAGLDSTCDAVIFVDAPREVRLARVRSTRGWDENELARREESQMALDEKRQRADYVLSNSGSLEHLGEQTRRILTTIVQSRGDR
jgi:dephospho-CoA kinase